MKKAFTLTEIIVTLSIIGVIAALTIPAVMKGYREKMYSAQLKKTVSQIENAAKTVMSDEHAQSFFKTTAGVPTTDDTDETVGAPYFLNNYLKNARTGCFNKNDSNANNCILKTYKTAGGTDVEMYSSYCVLTVNGSAVCMWNDTEKENNNIIIDINGIDAPNIIGVDVFSAKISADGTVISDGVDETKCGVKSSDWGHIVDYAQGCLQKVINNNWKITE